MAKVPYKRGIPSILDLIEKIIRLLVAFRDIVKPFLSVAQEQRWDELETACKNFRDAIPDYAPGSIVNPDDPVPG